MMPEDFVRWFETLSNRDVPLVGGKNASLGEMVRELRSEGVRVPDGFATTAAVFWAFVDANGLREPIANALARLARGEASLAETGAAVRARFHESAVPEPIADSIRAAYHELGRRCGEGEVDVAVRSSATAEDLPQASFAGQQESFLNIRGEEALLAACRDCLTSLFTDRAIAYRDRMGFDHMRIALSIGVQRMVRSDLAGAGVLFTLDTDTGFPNVVLIHAAWGLGENVVKGTVTPDQYVVFKPILDDARRRPILARTLGSKALKMIYGQAGAPTENVETTSAEREAYVLADEEILTLARWGAAIERHYGQPMDVEWAKDGRTGTIFVVQARPETVQSRKDAGVLRVFDLRERGEALASGQAVGEAIVAGPVRVVITPQSADAFPAGAILVTRRTDPDWVPLLRRAAGIVTDQGGRTSHAAIVSRELGIPAIVGTGDATAALPEGGEVTLSCAEGPVGRVYRGRLAFESVELSLEDLPVTRTRIMMNIASPAAAMRWWRLPCRGIGLARIEYLVNDEIKIHPMALLQPDKVTDPDARAAIAELTRGHEKPAEYFVERLARGIATIAASRWPDPVIVRTSDFKTNEYANLIGGARFEPHEENPMLGWRGAARYYSEGYRDGFALECRAIRRAREEIGLDNVVVMIPFCRTPEEADRVLAVMAENGLRRGENGLQVYVMAEIPSNVLEADAFAERFDGFSIGSNDLTQLVLGVDRDAESLAYLFDERRPSVKRMIRDLIRSAHAAGRPVGICGQAPSDHPEFAAFLVECGIDSISLNPDSVLAGLRTVAEAESRLQPRYP
jgi:pyruvate,water dikinase